MMKESSFPDNLKYLDINQDGIEEVLVIVNFCGPRGSSCLSMLQWETSKGRFNEIFSDMGDIKIYAGSGKDPSVISTSCLQIGLDSQGKREEKLLIQWYVYQDHKFVKVKTKPAGIGKLLKSL